MNNIFLAQVKGFKLNENQNGEYTVEFTEYPGEFITTETEIRNIPRVRITREMGERDYLQFYMYTHVKLCVKLTYQKNIAYFSSFEEGDKQIIWLLQGIKDRGLINVL